MKKPWTYLAAALVLTVSTCAATPVMSGAAPAALNAGGTASKEKVDLDAGCILDVNPIDPAKEAYRENMKTADITLDLYKVADAAEVEGYDAYQLKPLGVYDRVLDFSEYADLQKLKASDWESYAQETAKITLDPEHPQSPIASREVSWTEKTLLSAADMKAGLYLLVARDTELTKPSDYAKYVKVKKAGAEVREEKYVTITSTPQYEYWFEPQLIALPSRTADAGGVINTGNDGDWLYTQSVYLKPERENRYGSLKIRKTLRDYESVDGTIEPVTFVFRAVGTVEGETVYDEVASLTFTGPGNDEVTLEHVPAAATVTVTEIYSGISYTQVVPGENKAVVLDGISIEPGAVNLAEFENIYNNRRTNGHGIRNQFEYTDGEWNWQADPPRQAEVQGGE